MVRPVRIGLVFEPTVDMLRVAVEQVVSLWGGRYQPFFDPADLGQVETLARALGVDVLLALDRAPASELAAKLDGFQWQGREQWGPLTPAEDYTNHRLIGPERLLDDLSQESWVRPSWVVDDPLSDFFRIWFGTYGTSAQDLNLEKQFNAHAVEVRIDQGMAVPADASSWVTPITVTGKGIDYKGESPGTAFVIVDPADPASLTALWNARACGAQVFPIPVGHEERVLTAANTWLQQVLEKGELSRWTTGDGMPLSPRMYTWQAAPKNDLPPALVELMASHDVTPIVISPLSGQDLARGWYGAHPFTTRHRHNFSQPLEEDGRVVRITVPSVGTGPWVTGAPHGDILAFQVEFSSTVGVRPDWTFSIPNKRSCARLLRDYDGVMLSFDRPMDNGRVLAASSGIREVIISAVPSTAILEALIEAPGWTAQQTPGGVFLTRFIERLGGTESTLANQPGARAALAKVARSERGLQSGAIVRTVRSLQGTWPGPLARDSASYPAEVFRFLLRQGILRPVLPVDCPYCTSSIAFRPDDLATQIKCEMCLREFPLGLALGMKPNSRNEWLYQVAGHVGIDRLSEALPVMATLQVLCSRGYYRGSMTPYVLGWAVKGPHLDCEVDIAAVLDYRGLPAVVIGEIKSWQSSIDANDLTNLKKVQQHIRGQGVECFVLAAVMRDLRDDEKSVLRDFAEHPPNILPFGSSIEPVLPIVLTEKNLSTTRYVDSHPNHWAPADGVLGLAKESCRQNLGMTGLHPCQDGKDFHFCPQWQDGTSDPEPL